METLEQLQTRHSKERRDLQSRITSKKKSATKKTRKGVNTECDELELSLKLKQEQELAALNGDDTIPDVEDVPDLDDETTACNLEAVNGLADELYKTPVAPEATETSIASQAANAQRKRNRQKERLARRATEQEAAAVEAEKEAAKLPNWKRQERTGMLKTFKEHGLVEEEIRPDGHCLFSAVADQLAQAGIPLGDEAAGDGGYKAIRKRAAGYIESHPGDFEGFLEEPLDTHVRKIRDTAEWGGHVELTALARSYDVEIRVIQNTRTDNFEPEAGSKGDTKKIWLAYYLHGYGLGEHYNSLRKAP
ncbi:MAG: hypothetical protein M1818_004449 [Claussenomyces sp. TS43310]|nr:MAG: hypothetical protein M1818_004449 [Claussenomyces sp. TS43310]